MSSKEDIVMVMTNKTSQKLLAEIEQFLSETGMGERYFGKAAMTTSDLVPRLRNGGRVWPETEAKARAFMRERRKSKPAREAAE